MWSYDQEGQMVWGEEIPGYGNVHIADVRGWGYYLNKHSGNEEAATKEMDEVGELIAKAPQMAQEISALKEQLSAAQSMFEKARKSMSGSEFHSSLYDLGRVLNVTREA